MNYPLEIPIINAARFIGSGKLFRDEVKPELGGRLKTSPQSAHEKRSVEIDQ